MNRQKIIAEDKQIAIAKVIKDNSSSAQSFEDVIQTGVEKVTKTMKNAQGA